ncbi:MAG: hypothetical protein FWG02_08470, partial [Holophagaceae bacterium]|nr:hypothetical protein [Holophagaceae bacterium]
MTATRMRCPQKEGEENKIPTSVSEITSFQKCLAWQSRVSEGYREVFDYEGCYAKKLESEKEDWPCLNGRRGSL